VTLPLRPPFIHTLRVGDEAHHRVNDRRTSTFTSLLFPPSNDAHFAGNKNKNQPGKRYESVRAAAPYLTKALSSIYDSY
jgi:hypothetical protein